jgi:hypothetical protein
MNLAKNGNGMTKKEIKRTHTKLSQKEFDEHAKEKNFEEGPLIETFGDGYGEPYNPNRLVFGTLKGGEKVYAILGE